MLLFTISICSYAKGNSFGIGVETTIRPGKHNDHSHINSISLEGRYRFGFTSRFAVTPKVGIGTRWMDGSLLGPFEPFWDTALFAKFGAEASVRVVAGLSLLTGLEFCFELAELSHYSTSGNYSGSWAFDASYQLWRFQLRAAYNVEMYDQGSNGLGNSWTVGLR